MDAPLRVRDIIDGKYRVEEFLGQGGMGVVVAARHLTLGERVAIKFPVARLALRGDVVTRLVREGRAAMRIRSEHVARVFDVGTLATGEPYLVMEYLEGRDLGALVAERGPLPVGEAVELVLQASEALAEAHALGIVHRDLKPGNLFLTRRADGSPCVKVIDFGISRTGGPDPDPRLTDSAAVLGSPLYMSPEQMRAAREIDPRSDVWSLGATLCCLLTGAPPFPASSLIDIHELMLRGPPRLAELRPEARALAPIVGRCLARDPEARYPSMAELAEALAEHAPEHARRSAGRVRRTLAARPAAARSAAAADVPVSDAGPDEASTLPPTGASWAHATRRRVEAPVAIVTRRGTGARVAMGVVVATVLVAAAAWRGGRTAAGVPTAAPGAASIAMPPPETPADPAPREDASARVPTPVASADVRPSPSTRQSSARPARALAPRTRDPLADPD